MYKTGLASIAFRHLSVEQIIEAAKNAGLTYIEWGSDVHAPKDDLENLDRVAKLTREAGLEISSYGTYFKTSSNAPEEILDYITAAKRLGTNILRVWCFTTADPVEKERRYEVCRRVAEIAEENGVVICAECHSDTMTDNAESSLELMQKVNSPAFGMYWQAHEYFTAEENLEFIKAVVPYVTNVHVYNGQGQEMLMLKQAEDAWEQYVKVLGGDRIYLLEHLPGHDETLLPAQADTLRRILNTL